MPFTPLPPHLTPSQPPPTSFSPLPGPRHPPVLPLQDLVHVDGRQGALQGGGDGLHVDVGQPEIAEHQQGGVQELLLVHPVPA